jgi:hypothetical protein
MTLVLSLPLRSGGARPPEAAALTSFGEKRDAVARFSPI